MVQPHNTMYMLDELSRQKLVEHRINKAHDAIRDARFCANGGMYILAINRLYFACYYISSALLLHNRLYFENYSEVKALLNIGFVTTGKLDRDTAKTLSLLFESRQSGDYDDFVYYDESDYVNLEPKATKFVETLESLIASNS